MVAAATRAPAVDFLALVPRFFIPFVLLLLSNRVFLALEVVSVADIACLQLPVAVAVVAVAGGGEPVHQAFFLVEFVHFCMFKVVEGDGGSC